MTVLFPISTMAREYLQRVYGVNIGSLLVLDTTSGASRLEIQMPKRRIPLRNFILSRRHEALKEMHSSNLLDQTALLDWVALHSDSFQEAELSERLHIFATREWYVLRDDKTIVGVYDTGKVYNGFPLDVPADQVLYNLPGVFVQALDDLATHRDTSFMGAAPYVHEFSHLALTPRYVEGHGISKKTE